MKYLQKISAVLVLTLFLLSIIPMALADQDNDSDKIAKNLVRASKMAEERLEKAKENFNDAREDYNKLKEKYEEARTKQFEERKKLTKLNDYAKKCEAKNDSKDCQTRRIELKLGVKNHLEKTVDLVERALEKLRNRIENIDGLSEIDQENALTLVDNLDGKLVLLQEKITAFDGNTTKEEITGVIKELKELAQDANKLQRKLVGLLVNAKLGVLVEKHEEFRNGMEARIDSLAAEGVDTAELEEIMAEFDLAVEKLNKDFEIAQNKWNNAGTTEDFDEFVHDLREAQHQVREDLQKTKELLRKFLQKYRELKGEFEESDDNSTEADEDEEEEEESSDNSTETDEDEEEEEESDDNSTEADDDEEEEEESGDNSTEADEE